MDDASRSSSPRRARRSFWILVLVAVLAAGALSAALASEPGPLVGLRVAVSGLLLVASIVLAARVMAALDRAHRAAATLPGPRGKAHGRKTRR